MQLMLLNIVRSISFLIRAADDLETKDSRRTRQNDKMGAQQTRETLGLLTLLAELLPCAWVKCSEAASPTTTHRKVRAKTADPSSHRRKPTKKIPKTKLINQLLAAFGCQLHTMDSDLEEREVDR
jgi:hypothetical protein